MKSLTNYISESSLKEIKDGTINQTELDKVVKELADFGLNAAIAETTYQMGLRVAKKLTGTHRSTYSGSSKNGKFGYWQLEETLEKYFNKKEYKGETYWFDKSRKSINSWLHSNNQGTMENPNI